MNLKPDIRISVRERYGAIAERTTIEPADCGCGPNYCSTDEASEVIQLSQINTLYQTDEVFDLPAAVTNLSLGCGDPVTLASLKPGQTVLDLGSGGGIDCFLAGKQVGPSGRVIGVDMTPAMIERARANKIEVGADNVEFRLGEIEHLPVPDNSIDVIISNCVINLSPDKGQVLREAFRVLKPGGTVAISDIVTDGPLPQEIKDSISAWAGCIAGALEMADYSQLLSEAGFEDIVITPVQLDEGDIEDAAVIVADELDLDLSEYDTSTLQKTVFSARITAQKPK